MQRYRSIFALVLGAFWLVLALGVQAAPKAKLWDRWTAHQPASTLSVNHAAWQDFLSRNVVATADGVNRIDYAAVSDADRDLLERYLESLSTVAISEYRRDEQMAYWINLYNALTVKVVLDHYPVSSILKISISGLFSIGPWGKQLIEVEGEALALDDIEHRILRPIWRDPRVHYAVNCASIGCPNLRQDAFRPATLDTDLTTAAREYINSDRGVSFDGDRLEVSSIYAWFAEDFGDEDAAVIAHLSEYAEPALAKKLAATERIADDYYDWDLNDVIR